MAPQHLEPDRRNLPGHPQERVEPGTLHQDSAPIPPGAPLLPGAWYPPLYHPRRPAGRRRRCLVQKRQKGLRGQGEGLDLKVRRRQ